MREQGARGTPAPARSRGRALPVWMSLCRSKFPMLLKMRPQTSHGWMYLQADASSGRAGPQGARSPTPSSAKGRQKRGYVEGKRHEDFNLQEG